MPCLKTIRFLTLLGSCLTAAGARADLVFSAPPRESEAKAIEVYRPIADLFEKTLGEKVVFDYSDNWLTYQSQMRKGAYDLVFDGPAFIGWRMARLGHVPLAKLPGNLSFVVIVRNDNARVKELKDLAGRTICGFAPPNLATLTVQFQFDNPARQPILTEVQGFAQAYRNVVAGKCMAGILQLKLWENFEKEKPQTRAVFTSKPVANQAFTAGPRIPPVKRARLVEALLSEAGKAPTKKLRDEFKVQDFVVAKAEEYEGLGVLLQDAWGFDTR